jgi:cobalt/nickel transport system ATP-binding protein
MATHDVDLALRWADDAAVLSPDGLRTGPVGELLADQALLDSARLRRPWGTAVSEVLRAHGLLGPSDEGPRTPEALAAWTRRATTPGHDGVQV